MTGRLLTTALALTLSASLAYADQARQRWPSSSQGSSSGQGSGGGQSSGGQSSGGGQQRSGGQAAPAPAPAPRSGGFRSASPRQEAPPPSRQEAPPPAPTPRSGGFRSASPRSEVPPPSRQEAGPREQSGNSQVRRWASPRTEQAPSPSAPMTGGSLGERLAAGREAGEIQNQGQRRATSRIIEVRPSTPSSDTSLGAAVSPAPQANQRVAQPRRYPTAEEQTTARAVPRGTVQPAPRPGTSGGAYVYGRPTTRIYNNYYYYPRHYYPYGYGSYGLGFFYYDPYSWYGHSYPYYSSYSYPYYSSYPAYGGGIYQYRHGYPTGEIRLQVRPRWAEVYVDGYYAGRVDDFDGFIQALRIEEGPHTIEIVASGYETLVFDVRIIAGRKIEYRGDMIPFRP